jgi:hypothetical protein
MPDRQRLRDGWDHGNLVRNPAFHALGPDPKLVLLEFIPTQPTDFLTPAASEKAQPDYAGIIIVAFGRFPGSG